MILKKVAQFNLRLVLVLHFKKGRGSIICKGKRENRDVAQVYQKNAYHIDVLPLVELGKLSSIVCDNIVASNNHHLASRGCEPNANAPNVKWFCDRKLFGDISADYYVCECRYEAEDSGAPNVIAAFESNCLCSC